MIEKRRRQHAIFKGPGMAAPVGNRDPRPRLYRQVVEEIVHDDLDPGTYAFATHQGAGTDRCAGFGPSLREAHRSSAEQ